MGRRADGRLAQRGGLVEFLRVPGALFGVGARARGALYDRGLLRAHRAFAPVISVGNLSVGGTGKTPMIAWLARHLAGLGRRPGIVSRGYGAGADGAPNDEALMLRSSLPDVPHEQDPDRVAAAARLEAQGVDVILVDDGFQHRRLARDLDIVLMDTQRPFGLPAPEGGGEPVRAFLPRGLMREPLSALRRADVCVLTRAGEDVDVSALVSLIRRHAPDLPVVRSTHAPVGLSDFASGEAMDLDTLRGQTVDLVSGIGNPGAFEATARSLGATVRRHAAFPDHHRFQPGELGRLGDGVLALTTAKDAARLRALPDVTPPPSLAVLEVELVLGEGAAALEAALEAVMTGAVGADGEGAR